jgi:nucleotide-binding universal stress UspA family protein
MAVSERDTAGERPGVEAAVDPFDRIVCGVDRSEASLEAVRQARRLELPSSELVLVAVSETRLAVHTGMHAPRVADEIEAEAQAALEDASALAPRAGTRQVRGRPDDALLLIAKDEAATLVAVGSHGYRRGTGVAIGSVATRMLHDAPCSVLLARAPEDAATFPRSIVAGVDGSLPSLNAAAVAVSLGKRLGVPVTVLAATGSRADFNGDRLGASGLEISSTDAKPIPALLDAAADTDLLALGSRGLRGLRALGSVSERVAHRALSSLLVVREPA